MTTLPRDFAERERQRMWDHKRTQELTDKLRDEYATGLDNDLTADEREERNQRGASRWE